MSSGDWFLVPRRRPAARLRLFCFPHAGGSAAEYHGWAQAFGTDVEVWSANLPGRAGRLHQTPARRIRELIDGLHAALVSALDRPFVFFGHSMGALLAFELARSLRQSSLALPTHLLVSGHGAPQLPRQDHRWHELPDGEFLAKVRGLGGIPDDLFDRAEERALLELLLPTLRADFEVAETWSYVAEPPLEVPIAAFGGIDDREVSSEALDAWREQTERSFSRHLLAGNHFFIRTAHAELVARIGRLISMTPLSAKH
ncbi:MAG: alpha/beta fold hydrolase [Pseudomonadota bacterium]